MILFCIWVPVLFISGQLKKDKTKPYQTKNHPPPSGFTLEIMIFLEMVTTHREIGLSPDLMG